MKESVNGVVRPGEGSVDCVAIEASLAARDPFLSFCRIKRDEGRFDEALIHSEFKWMTTVAHEVGKQT